MHVSSCFLPSSLCCVPVSESHGEEQPMIALQVWSLACSCLLPGLLFCVAGRILRVTVLLASIFLYRTAQTCPHWRPLLLANLRNHTGSICTKSPQRPTLCPLLSLCQFSRWIEGREGHGNESTQYTWQQAALVVLSIYMHACWL